MNDMPTLIGSSTTNGGFSPPIRYFTGVTVVGTCKQCGGPVTVPHGCVVSSDPTFVYKPTRACQDCGAIAKEQVLPSWGPLLDMEDSK